MKRRMEFGGGEIRFNNLEFPLYYCFAVYPEGIEAFLFPISGWELHQTIPLSAPMIRMDERPVEESELLINNANWVPGYNLGYIPLINRSDRPLDLTGSRVVFNAPQWSVVLDRMPPVPPGGSVMLATNPEAMRGLMPDMPVSPQIPVAFDPGAEIIVLRSDDLEICRGELSFLALGDEPVGNVVITEINYNSSSQFNVGDWVELSASTDEVNIGGWYLFDSRDDHFYCIPRNTILSPQTPLIIAEQPDTFRTDFPDVEPVMGGFGFGFGIPFDQVRLKNRSLLLIDWVLFSDRPLWPEEADGTGRTLELTDTRLPNAAHHNWRPSIARYGTPGEVNSVVSVRGENLLPITPRNIYLNPPYPNPFNGTVHIPFTNPIIGTAIQFSIIDYQGRRVAEITAPFPGSGTVTWNAVNNYGRPLPSGQYWVKINVQTVSARPLIILK